MRFSRGERVLAAAEAEAFRLGSFDPLRRQLRRRLATRQAMEQVASAAGSLSESARTMGLDESDLQRLVQEVARAESAVALLP